MSKLTERFKNFKTRYKVAIFCAVLGAVAAIIAAIIMKPPVLSKQKRQHPEVKRINMHISEHLKNIDTEINVDTKQAMLIDIINQLERSNNIDPTDGETCFLFGEAYLRKIDYKNAIYHYNTSLEKEYYNVTEVYSGCSYAHEYLGDQYISNDDFDDFLSAGVQYQYAIDYLYDIINSGKENFVNSRISQIKTKKLTIPEYVAAKYEYLADQYASNEDFSSADVHFKYAIDCLNEVINSGKLSDEYTNKLKSKLPQIESKKKKNIYLREFAMINKDDNNNVKIIQELATGFADLKLWEYAVWCYWWLFKQNINTQSKLKKMRDFQYLSDLWEFSDDFDQYISNNPISAIINFDMVNFREEPIIMDNIIRKLQLYEDIQILQRSNFKETIGNVKTYWYKIRTNDDIEGWVYGRYLCFYPDL